ncbi:MAG: hypothetical protein HY744_27640 [Deltaproteobacteria bacterium]|nr:hypothetical protein [Deltaproteobacteria bacterium]
MRSKSRRVKGLGALFDGWQAGAAALVLAASSVVLAVPRAVEPDDLPLPVVDQRALQATMAGDDDLARRAEHEGLPFDVRALGRELREYNLAAAEQRDDDMEPARQRVAQAAVRAARAGESTLLALRAYQSVQFVRALQRWVHSAVAGRELAELGGEFADVLRGNSWCRGTSRELLPTERVLRAMYKKRWNDLTGLSAPPYALTLDEDRVRLGFLLRHPMLPARQQAGEQSPAEPQRREALENVARLATIDRLAARDPSYPAELGRGVVLYRLSRFGQATAALQRHLEQAPDGPHALRAQNYLMAALRRAQAERW